jgi:hypothetical protein
MPTEFQFGDRVRPKNGASDSDGGVVVQRQVACVYGVRLADGTIRYYSSQQLELAGARTREREAIPPIHGREERYATDGAGPYRNV